MKPRGHTGSGINDWIRHRLYVAGGRMPVDQLLDEVSEILGQDEIRTALRSLARDRTKRALGLRDVGGIAFGKRVGDEYVILSGPEGTKFTVEESRFLVRWYRDQSNRLRWIGNTHAKYLGHCHSVDLDGEMVDDFGSIRGVRRPRRSA